MSTSTPVAGEAGRVLCLTSTFPRWPGDATTSFVLHLVQDLQALGWRVDVLAPHAPGAARRELLDGVQVERFRYLVPERAETLCYQGGALINLRRSKANLAKVPALVGAEWAAAWSRLRSGRYDLLHSHWVLPQGYVGWLAARLTGVPHVLTAHGSDVFALRWPALRPFKRRALAAADAVTANSSATEAAIHAIAPGVPVARLPMGVDLGATGDRERAAALRARYRRGQGPLLVFVGRMVAEKGVEEVVRSVALLAPGRPDASAVLAGAGPDRTLVERLASELGVADRVHLPGWIDHAQVPDWLRAADVVLVPSRISADGSSEAQGLTILEAFVASRPVVASRVGGIPDLVTDGETGLLVPERDAQALAVAVERLCEDPALGPRLGERGRAVAEASFSRPVSAARFAELFSEVRARHRNHPARLGSGR